MIQQFREYMDCNYHCYGCGKEDGSYSVGQQANKTILVIWWPLSPDNGRSEDLTFNESITFPVKLIRPAGPAKRWWFPSSASTLSDGNTHDLHIGVDPSMVALIEITTWRCYVDETAMITNVVDATKLRIKSGQRGGWTAFELPQHLGPRARDPFGFCWRSQPMFVVAGKNKGTCSEIRTVVTTTCTGRVLHYHAIMQRCSSRKL